MSRKRLHEIEDVSYAYAEHGLYRLECRSIENRSVQFNEILERNFIVNLNGDIKAVFCWGPDLILPCAPTTRWKLTYASHFAYNVKKESLDVFLTRYLTLLPPLITIVASYVPDWGDEQPSSSIFYYGGRGLNMEASLGIDTLESFLKDQVKKIYTLIQDVYEIHPQTGNMMLLAVTKVELILTTRALTTTDANIKTNFENNDIVPDLTYTEKCHCYYLNAIVFYNGSKTIYKTQNEEFSGGEEATAHKRMYGLRPNIVVFGSKGIHVGLLLNKKKDIWEPV